MLGVVGLLGGFRQDTALCSNKTFLEAHENSRVLCVLYIHFVCLSALSLVILGDVWNVGGLKKMCIYY